jgi:C1A family cysteine protease
MGIIPCCHEREKTMPTKKRFGWKPDIPDHRDHMYEVTASGNAAPVIDLTSKCPPIYDQGQLGSCTANAIAAAIEFDTKKEGKPDFMPSRLFIYYNERALEGTIKSDAGAAIRDGIKVIAKQGDCPETLWPYNVKKFAKKPNAAAYAAAIKHEAINYNRITSLAQMKACLAGG